MKTKSSNRGGAIAAISIAVIGLFALAVHVAAILNFNQSAQRETEQRMHFTCYRPVSPETQWNCKRETDNAVSN